MLRKQYQSSLRWHTTISARKANKRPYGAPAASAASEGSAKLKMGAGNACFPCTVDSKTFQLSQNLRARRFDRIAHRVAHLQAQFARLRCHANQKKVHWIMAKEIERGKSFRQRQSVWTCAHRHTSAQDVRTRIYVNRTWRAVVADGIDKNHDIIPHEIVDESGARCAKVFNLDARIGMKGLRQGLHHDRADPIILEQDIADSGDERFHKTLMTEICFPAASNA